MLSLTCHSQCVLDTRHVKKLIEDITICCLCIHDSYTYMHIHIYICTYIYIYIHIYMHILYTYIHTYIYIYIHYIYIYIHIYMHILYTYTHISTSTCPCVVGRHVTRQPTTTTVRVYNYYSTTAVKSTVMTTGDARHSCLQQ